MPEIPTFTNTMPAAVVPLPRTDVAESNRVADAIAVGGLRLEAAAEPWAARAAARERSAQASDAMVEAQASLGAAAQKWLRRSGTVDENGEITGTGEVVNGFTGEAQQLRQRMLERIADPVVKGEVADQFNEALIRHAQGVRSVGFELESKARVGKLDQQLYQLSQEAAQAPTPLAKDMVARTATTAINTMRDAGYMSGEFAAQRQIEFTSNMQRIAAEQDRNAALQSGDPKQAAAWAAKINDPKSYPGLMPQFRETLGYRADLMADRMANKAEVRLRAAVHGAWQDNVASIEATGAPVTPLADEMIRAAFPEDAERRIEALKLARDTYQARQSTALSSPTQDAELVQKFAPQGAGFAEQARAQTAVARAIQAKREALGSDPASYVMTADPDTAAALAAAAKDPGKMTGAIAALDAAYDRLGLPPEMRRVMPQDQAVGLSATIESDPANAPARMKALEQQYGNAWPRAWRDLVQIGKLPPAYQAVPTLADERDGALLARWLAEVPKGKTGADLIGAKTETQIKASVSADPTVQAYLASLSRSGASLQQADGILQAIQELAFARAYFDRDPNAAANAVRSFTGRYDFSLPGGPRVPLERIDAVRGNAGLALGKLTRDSIAVPELYGKPGMPSAEDYLRALKLSPTWLTSPDADALWLMDPGGRLVRGQDGQPLAVPFAAPAPPIDALRALGAGVFAPTQR